VMPSSRAPPRRLGARRDHDERQVSERRYLSEASMALLNKPANSIEDVAPPALLTA
jgi:putative transposase